MVILYRILPSFFESVLIQLSAHSPDLDTLSSKRSFKYHVQTLKNIKNSKTMKSLFLWRLILAHHSNHFIVFFFLRNTYATNFMNSNKNLIFHENCCRWISLERFIEPMNLSWAENFKVLQPERNFRLYR